MKVVKVTKEELKNIEKMSDEQMNKIRDELIVNSKDTFINHYGISETVYDKLIHNFNIEKESWI